LAVALKVTGDVTVAPFEGEVRLMVCARAAVARNTATAAQHMNFFNVRLLEKCPEEPKVPVQQLQGYQVSGWVGPNI
jgi:hypothetical protein